MENSKLNLNINSPTRPLSTEGKAKSRLFLLLLSLFLIACGSPTDSETEDQIDSNPIVNVEKNATPTIQNIESLNQAELLVLFNEIIAELDESQYKEIARNGLDLMSAERNSKVGEAIIELEPTIVINRIQSQATVGVFNPRGKLNREALEIFPNETTTIYYPYIWMLSAEELSRFKPQDKLQHIQDTLFIEIGFDPSKGVAEGFAPVITINIPSHYDLNDEATIQIIKITIVKELIAAGMFTSYINTVSALMTNNNLPLTVQTNIGEVNLLAQAYTTISTGHNNNEGERSGRQTAAIDLGSYMALILAYQNDDNTVDFFAKQPWANYAARIIAESPSLVGSNPEETTEILIKKTLENYHLINNRYYEGDFNLVP